MPLPTGSLFVDPNIQIVAPQLPEQELKYAWDKTQAVYDKNFEDATKLGILAKTIKSRQADSPEVQQVLDPYFQGLKRIAEKGDYENQAMAVNALSLDFLGNKELAHLQHNYQLEEADKALKRDLKAKGLDLDFAENNKRTGFQRDNFKSIQINPTTGERELVEYTPGVEQRLDWDSRKQNLMSNIVRSGSSYIKDKLKSLTISGTELQILVKGNYNELSPTTKNNIAELLTSEYIDGTAEGHQEYRKLTEIDGLSDKDARDQIRKSMENIGEKQVSKITTEDYTPITPTPPTSPNPPYGYGVGVEGQPVMLSTEEQASKTYKDLSDAYYDAAAGNKSAKKAVSMIRSEFFKAHPEYKKIDEKLSQTIKSLKLSPKDEFSLRGAINDSNAPYLNQTELLSYLDKKASEFAKLSLEQKAKITTFLDSPEIYEMESKINSFANQGFTGGAYTRTPIIWQGEAGQKAQQALLDIVNQPGVKSAMYIDGEGPEQTLADKKIVGINPYKSAEKGQGIMFSVSYEVTEGNKKSIETKDVYVKPSLRKQDLFKNPLLLAVNNMLPQYNFIGQDIAAKFGDTEAGITSFADVLNTFEVPKSQIPKQAHKFKIDYTTETPEKPSKIVIRYDGDPTVKLNIASVAKNLAAAFGADKDKALGIIQDLMLQKTGATSVNQVLELNDVSELDEIFYTASIRLNQ